MSNVPTPVLPSAPKVPTTPEGRPFVMEVRIVASNGEYIWVCHGLGTTEAEALASATLPEGYSVSTHETTRSGLDPEHFALTKGRYPKDVVV